MSLPLLRSLLFVPGSRPERFEKALLSGADMTCIDLEDAVLPEDKTSARQSVRDYLSETEHADKVVIRVNPSLSTEGQADIAALLTAGQHPRAIMLPKASSAEEIAAVCQQLNQTDIRLIALLETVQGVQQAAAIGQASDRVDALMFGGADYSADIGCEFSYEPLLLARMQLVQAKASQPRQMQLIDVPHIDLTELEHCFADTSKVKALGFTGKAAIHPKQLTAIHKAFTPTEKEIANAKAIIDAVPSDNAGVVVVNGRMVDRPIILAARRTLALAAIAGKL
ncbi:HpcH/HpaI aldolase/citrate lyase family protein [Thalassotalea mangrovi]|uniref:CoA ester lyase n=1 Tax=Thalassotalea mangrovi TaxID=2572245 RepID=A0A4U1B1R7_9GAMM|nr:CoA ester lyase [Thalassotalea mangrovi]TKB43262.1 CoA ester lyase [Thalassotalea mangrovi]